MEMALNDYITKPSVSDQPKYEDLVIAYEDQTTGACSEKRSLDIYLLVKKLILAISK